VFDLGLVRLFVPVRGWVRGFHAARGCGSRGGMVRDPGRSGAGGSIEPGRGIREDGECRGQCVRRVVPGTCRCRDGPFGWAVWWAGWCVCCHKR